MCHRTNFLAFRHDQGQDEVKEQRRPYAENGSRSKDDPYNSGIPTPVFCNTAAHPK